MNKAIIMAGGFGTRLRPLTMKIPKPMVPILNKPMMDHIVSLLKKHNINDVVSLLYFEPDKIKSYFGNGEAADIKMNYVIAQADYGTAGAVKNAYELVKDRFIVISGDVLTDFDITAALNFHEEKKAIATVLLTRVPAPLQYGIVMTDNDGKITRFLEKPSWGQVFSDTINTGIYIFEPEALDLIPYREEFDFSKDLFPLMLQNDMPLYGYIADGYWRDVGNLNEYQAGQFDALKGVVNLEESKKIINNLSFGQNTFLPDSVTLLGKNVIGDNSQFGENCEIKDSVIGNNVIIGNGVRLNGVTLWDNVEIGDFAELTDDVVCNNTKIGDFALIAENVFIAENCQIGSHARLFSNIKLWPNKIVEAGSQLSRSLVQEEKWQRELFTDARISGLSNIEINPEFGAKLGSALGCTFGKGTTLLASREPDSVSRIMKRAISAGLLSVGVYINDLQQISIPQNRQELRIGKYAGGFHVRRSPRNPDITDIIIFNKDGRDISIDTTKKIERYFFGEDIERVAASDVGEIYFPERTNEIYFSRYLSSLDIEAIKSRKFKLLMDYSFGLASSIFPGILGKLSAEVLSLNNYIDGSRFHPDPNGIEGDTDNTGRIMSSLGYQLGFRMQGGAEKISVIDERGVWYTHTRLLTILTKLFLETNKHREPYKIAVSIVAPSEIEMIAKDYDVEVIRIKNSHSAMMEETLDEKVLFVGGIYGGFIFRDFLFASDGMYTVGKMLEMLAITDLTTSKLDEVLPRRFQCGINVSVPWEYKGTVMRRAMEYSDKYKRELVEGVKIYESDESVLLLPDKEKAAFIVYGEGDTELKAKRIAEKYASLINKWKS
jgi:mannose-1-phosphate guanylyltransferase / phosphomannomutase